MNSSSLLFNEGREDYGAEAWMEAEEEAELLENQQHNSDLKGFGRNEDANEFDPEDEEVLDTLYLKVYTGQLDKEDEKKEAAKGGVEEGEVVDEEQRAKDLKQMQEIEVADLVNIATGATPKVHSPHAHNASLSLFLCPPL